jgi:uncharacterized membrane-anchored protein
MLALPEIHPERFNLAEEVHARPYERIDTPSRATHLSMLVNTEQRTEESAHLARLCERYQVAAPGPRVTHHSASLGTLRLRWERHGEFSSYTLIGAANPDSRFDDPVAALLTPGWIEAIPGQTMFAANALLLPASPELMSAEQLAIFFAGNSIVGAEVADGAALAYTDFRIHADGFSRILVLDRGLNSAQAGRTLQRLFEIESYRMMALLALPIARRQSPRMLEIERALASLTDDIARDGGDDETLLHELTRLAAEVESGLAASQFRFGACRAYAELVQARLAQLAERRLTGLQTLSEFMGMRFAPAVATCTSVSQRLHDLSERVAQASGLLSTRVNIARERQNQVLLESMDRRARQQLRLQQTVEGLSVAAIVYYVCSVIGLAAKATKEAGVNMNPEIVVGLAIPLVALAVLMTVRRARSKL